MAPFPRQRQHGLRLPLDPSWTSEDDYVQSVLAFATTSDIFRNLCGGVHILDFLTREPDLYTTVLPQEWREWFELVDIGRVLDLLMHDDLAKYDGLSTEQYQWGNGATPPRSLL